MTRSGPVVCLVVLVVLASSPSPIEAQTCPTCARTGTWEDFVVFRGFDEGGCDRGSGGGYTLAGCRDWCANDAGCGKFGWREDGGAGTGTCWRKNYCYQTNPNANGEWVFGYKKRSCVASACQCNSVLGMSGPTCSTHSLCATNPCRNGGTCTPNILGKSPECHCLPGYFGLFCSGVVTDSPCASGNGGCLNGAICSVAASGDAVCQCASGFMGPTCGVTVAAGAHTPPYVPGPPPEKASTDLAVGLGGAGVAMASIMMVCSCMAPSGRKGKKSRRSRRHRRGNSVDSDASSLSDASSTSDGSSYSSSSSGSYGSSTY